MKKLKHLGLYTLILLCLSCTENLKLTDYVDSKQSFELVDIRKVEKNLTGKKKEISKGSEVHNKLIEWIKNNRDDWKSTPVSYIASISVTQNDFKLIYLNDSESVVVSYKNLKGEMKQYVKGVEKGDLNFLYLD